MRRLFTILLFLAISNISFAQQDMLVSQYMFSGMFLNPAYAGSHPYFNATGLYRKQWVGFEGAPTSQFLSLDGPLKNKNVGVGLLLSNDKIGVQQQTEIHANYAYHIPLNDRAKLSLGLRGGVANYSANLSELTYWDKDEVFEEDVKNVFMPNFGMGAYYYSELAFVGISVPHLINYDPTTKLKVDVGDAHKLVRNYWLHAGYVFKISPFVALKPSMLVKYTPNTPIQADANLNMLLNERIWIGGSYRTDQTAVAIFEFLATKQLRVGYAYDFAFSRIRKYNSGSHEIMIAFDFGQDLLKMKNPRYF